MAQNVKQQGAVQHKCPNCGASLFYDPASGKLTCKHCNSFVEFDKDDTVRERDFEELYTASKWKDSDVATYRCQNCGAQSITPRTTLATLCPYCNSPVVVADLTGAIVKPDTIIPFEVPKEDANDQLIRWRRKCFWAPKSFKKLNETEGIRGVYLPVWTFDADTETDYNGRLGKRRTRTVHRNGKSYTETYTEWFHVRGTMPAVFDDVVVRASGHLTDSEFKVVEPLDQSRYMAFDDEYLAGYTADHYTLDPHEAFKIARARMLNTIRQKIINYYHADVEGVLNLNLHVLSKSFKYVFAPVYVAASRYKGKLYRQYVSGVYRDRAKKLCKVQGSAPKAAWKIALAVLLGLGVLVGLGFLAYWIVKNGNEVEVDEFDYWGRMISQGVNAIRGGL